MVFLRKLLSLSFLNLSLKRGLVLHRYFGANIRESESHREEQISSRRERGAARQAAVEGASVGEQSSGAFWKRRTSARDSRAVHARVLVRERRGPRASRPPAPSQ